MDENAKKTALRMIPYGLYVLTAENAQGEVAAATVNWVTQASFAPPLLAVGVKKDSGAYALIKETRAFALNMLGKEQGKTAYAFFKPTVKENGKVSGEAYRSGTTGAPLLESCPAYVECKLVDELAGGDHAVFLGEVVEAGVARAPAARPDDAVLWLKDLGEKVFYGG